MPAELYFLSGRKNPPGGYIRILKCGYRTGDKAPMAYVELVDRPQPEVIEGDED